MIYFGDAPPRNLLEMANELETRPLACRVPSDPGWRAMYLVHVEGQPVARFEVVEAWGLTAPIFNLEARCPRSASANLYDTMAAGHSVDGFMRPLLWPIGAGGKPCSPIGLFDVVGPDETNEQAHARMTLYLSQVDGGRGGYRAGGA